MRFPPQILFQGSGALPSPALHSFQTHFYKSVKTVSGFPGGSMVKNPPSNAGNTRDTFDPWVQKIPWRRKWKPIPVLLPGKFRGQRSLVGYSKWGRKESDTTEHTHTHTHLVPEHFTSQCIHIQFLDIILFTQMNDCQMTRLVNTCYRGNFPFKKLQHTHTHRAGLSAETWQMADLIPQRWSFKHTLHGVSTFKSSVRLQPMDCSMPGSSVLHPLLEFAPIHVHWVSDAIYFILCHSLLLLPSILPSIKVFSNELALSIKWPKYWSLQTYFWVHPPRWRMEMMLTFASILCWIILAQAPLWIYYPSPLTLGLKIPQFCYGGATVLGKIPDVLLNWLQVINPPSPALSWLCLLV